MQEQLNEFTKKKLPEYGPTGYEPVKPGDNNNKPAQSSLKVDGPCNNDVGRFLLNIFFLYGRNATWLGAVQKLWPHGAIWICIDNAVLFEILWSYGSFDQAVQFLFVLFKKKTLRDVLIIINVLKNYFLTI